MVANAIPALRELHLSIVAYHKIKDREARKLAKKKAKEARLEAAAAEGQDPPESDEEESDHEGELKSDKLFIKPELSPETKIQLQNLEQAVQTGDCR